MLVCKFLMIIDIFVMAAQTVFAFWSLLKLNKIESSGECQYEQCALLLRWLHYLKIVFNLYTASSYLSNIKNGVAD